jgi:Ca2+-transporting ATPase
MFFGMIMGLPVVLTPIQILLINLVTDSLPALALGVDPPEKNIMSQRPRPKNSGVFSNGLAGKILVRGIFIGLTTLAVFVGFLNKTNNLELSRTAALVTLIFTQLIHVFECKSETLPIYKIPIFNNVKLILSVLVSAVIVILSVYFQPLRNIFSTTPLTLSQLAVILLSSLTVPVLSGIFFKPKKAEKE